MLINKLTKQNILVFLGIVWMVFSVGYIAVDQWRDFKARYARNAYQKGVSDSVRALMSQAEKCVKVPLFDGEKRLEVVSVSCLQDDSQDRQNER